MSKKVMIVAALAIVFGIATAQKKTTPATTTAGTSSVITEQQAYAIIKYSNAVIDLHNSYIQALRSHQNTLENTADENVKKLTRNIKTQPFFVQCDRNNLPADQDKANRTTLKNVPAIPEKQSLQGLGTQALSWYDKTNTYCSSISNYFSNKEYQSDVNFTKYATLKDSMQNSMKQSAAYWSKFAQVASEAGDRAELVLLKKNKLAVYVIPMKQSLIGIDKIKNMLNSDNANMDSVNLQITNVQSLVSQKLNDKATDFSKLSDAYYKEVYANFYKSCINCLTQLQVVTGKIKANAPQQDIVNAYKSVSSAYNGAVEEYNSFIKQ